MKFKIPDNSKYLLVYGCLTRICDGDPCIGGVLNILNTMKQDEQGQIITNSAVIAEWSHGTFTRRKAEEAIRWLLKAGYISRQLRPGLDPIFSVNEEKVESAITQESLQKMYPVDPKTDIVEDPLPTKNVGTTPKVPTENVGTPYEKCTPLPTKNVGTPYKKCRDFSPKNSHQSDENKDTYEDFENTLIKGSKLEVRIKEENTELKDPKNHPGSAIATPVMSVVETTSLALEKENLPNAATVTTSAIIPTSTPLPGQECKTMNNSSVLAEIFVIYNKIPDKKRDSKCKGSASRLLQNWGDKLKPVVDDIGSEALVAMENFLQDPYWQGKGFPLPAFKSQYRKYLSTQEPEEQSRIETKTQSSPKSSPSTGYSNSFAYTDRHYIAPVSAPDATGAIFRKREALDILQHIGGALEAECRAEIGHKIDDSMHRAIESWHGRATEAYRKLRNREYPVLTEPIKGI